MAFTSVDQLQSTLTESVFHYAKDSKKAAGRALGTLVEVITYYLLQAWALGPSTSIERSLPEYGNPDITHNVEYSLHPTLREIGVDIELPKLPLTAAKILKQLESEGFGLGGFQPKGNQLLTSDRVLRNACTIAESATSSLVAFLDAMDSRSARVEVIEQQVRPYALFECKRVGVEEGMKKGPQTIEKAKQGAYVARTVSALQKFRMHDGRLGGVLHLPDGTLYYKPYRQLLAEVLASSDRRFLSGFVLTVGVVSNHGNWFTAENHNKEMKVLGQSYDWLVFSRTPV